MISPFRFQVHYVYDPLCSAACCLFVLNTPALVHQISLHFLGFWCFVLFKLRLSFALHTEATTRRLFVNTFLATAF